jgi:hypothetical protein
MWKFQNEFKYFKTLILFLDFTNLSMDFANQIEHVINNNWMIINWQLAIGKFISV